MPPLLTSTGRSPLTTCLTACVCFYLLHEDHVHDHRKHPVIDDTDIYALRSELTS